MRKIVWIIILFANFCPRINFKDNQTVQTKANTSFELNLKNELDLENNAFLCEYNVID